MYLMYVYSNIIYKMSMVDNALVWGQNSLINNECTEKDSQMYFVIYI